MTVGKIALNGFVEKSSDADLRKKMIAVIAFRMMEKESEVLTGTAHGERSLATEHQVDRILLYRR